jgi:hypothetical protein
MLLVYALFRQGMSNPPAGMGTWLQLLVTRAFLWPAVIVLPALAWFYSDVTVRGRMIRLSQFGIIFAGLMGLLWILHRLAGVIANPIDEPVWMPRYLGVIWPAVAIGAVALLMRLPTRSLRLTAIGVLLGVNVLQGYAYAYVASEPPIDRVAREVLDMGRPGSHVLVYTPLTDRGKGAPGGGQINSIIGTLYLLQYSGQPSSPRDFRQTHAGHDFGVKLDASSATIARDIRLRPDVDRVVLWEKLDEAPMADPVLAAMGTDWSLRDERVYPVRVSWNWGWVYDYRRREYVKAPLR